MMKRLSLKERIVSLAVMFGQCGGYNADSPLNKVLFCVSAAAIIGCSYKTISKE